MIELKELDLTTQYQVSRNIEDFFVVAKKSNHFKSIFDKYKYLFKKNLHDTLWVFITGSAKAIRYGNTKFFLPLSTNSCSEANKFTKQKHSIPKIKEVIDVLETNNLITFYKGFFICEDYSMLSFVDLKEDWISSFSKPICERFGMGRELDLVEIIHTDYKKTKGGRKRKVKTHLPTTGVYGINNIKMGVLKYNKVLSNNEVSIKGEIVKNLIYKRTYEGDLFSHGRWYTVGDFQSHSKEDRKTIEFNGIPSVEVDLRSCQPSILYSWSGIKKPSNFDPYTITLDTSVPYNKQELRSLCKVALLCLMFNDSRRAASAALREHLDDDRSKSDKGERCYKSLYDIDKVVTQIMEKLLVLNKDIAHHFFTGGLWKRLQYSDSKICELIIQHFTNKNVPIIAIHDSWVAPYMYRDELIWVMEQSWKEVVKDDGLNFGYDIEFDNTPNFS